MRIFVNNGLLHPIRALKIALRRWVVNSDKADPMWNAGELPPYLSQFEVGESLPWKGVRFKVGKIVGGDFPVVILVPVDRTHGHKLKTLRAFRDAGRSVRDERKAITESMKAVS